MNLKNMSPWRLVIALIAILFISQMFFTENNEADRHLNKASPVSYSELLRRAKSGDITRATVYTSGVVAETRNAEKLTTSTRDPQDVGDRLVEHGVEVSFAPPEQGSLFGQIIVSLLPVLVLVGLYFWMMRSMRGGMGGGQGGQGGLFGFGKARVKMISPDQDRKTFADIAGADEAKNDLQELVDFLRDPQKYSRLGGKIPKGGLLVGPPGTGKTLLARAVAGEAGVPFFTLSGSDFVEMFVGVGASRVRDLFKQARDTAPCIIFIDEIDAVGRQRGAGLGGGNDEREQTLNQMLVEMDGFEPSLGIIILAATNRPDVLDPALLRPGRFDRQIVVPNPDINGRTEILKVHTKAVPVSPDVDVSVIARGTPGFAGADLANLVNEAALAAARRNSRVVAAQDFETAKDKIMMGAERRSLTMTDDEKRLTAYHEAGHAVTALLSPDSDPIHKATIVPRGRALGMVMRLPEGDRVSMTYARLKADLVVAMGGRAAEELIFGEDQITTGAAGDISMATDMARRMVTEWGMSQSLGLVKYVDNSQEVFLGKSVTQSQHISDTTAQAIDKEVREIIETAYQTASNMLTTHQIGLEAIAQALLDRETLDGDEVRAIFDTAINGQATETPA